MLGPAAEPDTRYVCRSEMKQTVDLTTQFETARADLRALALRMLGSLADADDAVQEVWLRVARADTSSIAHVRGWLITITGRVCLDVLRARRRRRSALAALEAETGEPPEREDLEARRELADAVGLALLVVLDRLTPAERVAFVLHEACSLPFDQIAAILARSPVAAKKLASRARQRLYPSPRIPAGELARQRALAERFLAASRAGDVGALLALLSPDVVRHEDISARGPHTLRGAARVAEETVRNARLAGFARVALVEGRVGVVVAPLGVLRFVIELDLHEDRIRAYTVTGRRERLRALSLALLA